MDFATLTPTLATIIAAVLVALGALIGVLVRGGFDTRLLGRQLVEHRDLTAQQLTHQKELAESQLSLQRETLVVEAELRRERDAKQRSEARAYELLSERRSAYSVFLNQAKETETIHAAIIQSLRPLVEEFPSIDWAITPREVEVQPHTSFYLNSFTNSLGSVDVSTRPHQAWAYRGFVEAECNKSWDMRNELGLELAVLELIAPQQVVAAAQRVYACAWVWGHDLERTTPAEFLEHVSKRRQELSSARGMFLQKVRSDLGSDVTLVSGEAAS